MTNIEIQFDRLIKRCIAEKVSDIHIFGSDSQQQIVLRKHKHFHSTEDKLDTRKLFHYLKFLGNFDVSTTKPQTKVFRYYVEMEEYLIRFAGIESFQKYSGVVRLLNINSSDQWDILCPDIATRNSINSILRKNSGILIFVGRTGSGKSTSMFYALSQFEHKQIYTLENPIERINKKWIQIETECIEEHLTQLLRHDPDIIVLGELRTVSDIVELIRAGLSGHLVVATMHASSLKQTIRRLTDLGACIEDLKELLEGVVLQEMIVNETGEVHVNFNIYSNQEIKELL